MKPWRTVYAHPLHAHPYPRLEWRPCIAPEAPLFWEDHISQALSFEGAQSQALAREALTAPLYKTTAEAPDQEPGIVHNLHMQQVVRVSDGMSKGMGVLAHLCIGPYAPYGFTGFFSGVSL